PMAHAAPFGPEPGADMHLVDRHRLRPRIGGCASFDPVCVGPGEYGRRGHDRSGARRLLMHAPERIGLPGQLLAARPADSVFVHGARLDARNEELPGAGALPAPHWVAA